MKSDAFVSVIIIVERPDDSLRSGVAAVWDELNTRYSDYELILIVQGPARRLVDARLADILATTPGLRLIQLAYAVDYEVACSAGIDNAIGDFVVIFDPIVDRLKSISDGVVACQKGTDIIIGVNSRPLPPLYGLTRSLASRLLAAIDYQIPANATGFRCVSRRAINAVIETGRFHHQFAQRLQKTGYSSEALVYETKVDVHRQRSLFRAARRFLRLLVFNSSRPLRWMSGVGLLGSFLGFSFAVYVLLVRLLKRGVVEGWTTTVLFLSVQFMLLFVILAFISEYLSRLLEEQRGTSDYAVIYEKHSPVGLGDARVNVLSQSTSTEINEVQTAIGA
ncbi:hypothetical protein QA645_17565 [Bradyrhizobium sp. CIAT3101]|uniref:hypothetical protein n=1 Tax=Bradyrhizobium sp. CIAT3101 TaxID=439387 RepID=UPI0024B27A69|nr:hypothetical protein [Bradyrhizobium sp. CIAT3101]WFU84471.1 hypothetical protein QA645_17565 [Bradyrhizobium sp. CIAT3101]